MTRSAADFAHLAITEAIEPARHLDAALVRLASWWQSRDQSATLTDDDRDRLHAFLRRFEQLYDLIGRKLLRAMLVLSGEDARDFTLRQLFRWAEKRGALPSADDWLALGELRNRLVHDYPIGMELQIEHVVDAMAALPVLRAALAAALADAASSTA